MKYRKIENPSYKLIKLCILRNLTWLTSIGWGAGMLEGVLIPLVSIFYFNVIVQIDLYAKISNNLLVVLILSIIILILSVYIGTISNAY